MDAGFLKSSRDVLNVVDRPPDADNNIPSGRLVGGSLVLDLDLFESISLFGLSVAE